MPAYAAQGFQGDLASIPRLTAPIGDRLSFPARHVHHGKVSFGNITMIACIDQISDIAKETIVSVTL